MKCKNHPALPVALGTILKLHHASTRRRRERGMYLCDALNEGVGKTPILG